MLRPLIALTFGLLPAALASPITVTLSGNFGASSGDATLFDHQNYSVMFTIPDPSSPTRFFDAPGGIGQISAIYDVPAILSVPGIGFSVVSPVEVVYNNQAPLGLWLNVGVFRPLPVGDFLVLTPFQTISGAPLWNGLAGARGTPEITLLTAEAGSARWFLEQNTSDRGAIPIAVYDHGPIAITAAPTIPEASTIALTSGGLLAMLGLRRRKLI
jgi:hypothetical protein